MTTPYLCAAAALMTAASASIAADVGIRVLQPIAGFTVSDARAISADGLRIGGRCEDQNGTTLTTMWSATTGLPITIQGLPGAGTIVGLGANGSTFLGIRPAGPYRFTLPSTLEPLSTPTAAVAGISASGGIIVGSSQGQAARWLTPTSPSLLGILPNFSGSQGNGISADGATIAGTSTAGPDAMAFRWTSAGLQPLGVVPGQQRSVARGISGDGQTIVGFCNDFGNNAGVGFKWTPTTGIRSLGTLPGSAVAEATAASHDGSVIVGSAAWNPPGGLAVIWLAGDTTPRDLNVYLPSIGVDLSGWVLNMTRSVSADGSTIIGYGLHNGQTRAFVAVIPAPGTAILLGLACGLAARRRRR